jgi:hypothetical protein
MALMTPEQFEASLKGRKPRVFMNGKRVDKRSKIRIPAQWLRRTRQAINGPWTLNTRTS